VRLGARLHATYCSRLPPRNSRAAPPAPPTPAPAASKAGKGVRRTDRSRARRAFPSCSTPSNARVWSSHCPEGPAQAAHEHGIQLEVVGLPEAKRGFVLLPRRWVVERSFARAMRFRRLVKDFERLPETLRALYVVAFAALMLTQFLTTLMGAGPEQILEHVLLESVVSACIVD